MTVPAGNAALDARAVRELHRNADTDGSPKAIHHTLGPGANQAAPGNHTHDGGQSATLDSVKLPVPVKSVFGSLNPVTAAYTQVGATVAFTCAEATLVWVDFSGLLRAQGTGTNDVTCKVVATGATTFDSAADIPNFGGRLYQWVNATDVAYSKISAGFYLIVGAGTTTFAAQAIRSAAGTLCQANSLAISIAPLGLAANYA